MKYHIISKCEDLQLYFWNDIIESFKEEVNYYIKIGWKPKGGISTCTGGNKIILTQVVIKK